MARFGCCNPATSIWTWQSQVPAEFEEEEEEETQAEEERKMEEEEEEEDAVASVEDLPLHHTNNPMLLLSSAPSTEGEPLLPILPGAEAETPSSGTWDYRPVGIFGFFQWVNSATGEAREYPPIGARVQKSASTPLWTVRCRPLDPDVVEYGTPSEAGVFTWQTQVPGEFSGRGATGGGSGGGGGGGGIASSSPHPLLAPFPANSDSSGFAYDNPIKRRKN